MSLRFITAASTVGTLIEWYDFFAYASVSPYISAKFFPKGDPIVASLLTWLIFATAFVVRPLGAVLFGHLGDRVGRKATFLATLTLMGLSTFAIGLLPTYEQVGVLAPFLLALFRILQGVSLGGEYGGALTYVLEHAPPNRRAFYAGFLSATPPAGLALSSLTLVSTSLLLSRADIETWGWRVPFLLSIALTMLGVYLRLRLTETPLFEAVKREGKVAKVPVVEAFTKYSKWIAVGVVISAGHAVLAYTSTGYIFTYLTQVAKLDPLTVNLVVGVAALLQYPFYIINAWLADKYGRKRIYMTGLALGLLTYYPIYQWLGTARGLAETIFAVFILIYATAFTFSVLGTAIAELFPTRVRYTGMSVTFNIGVGVFGGFTPTVVQLIGISLQNPLAGLILYTYVVAALALVVAYFYLPETAAKRLE